MKLLSFVRTAVLIAALPALVAAQSAAPSQTDSQPIAGAGTKIGIIDIDRIAAQSDAGKALIERLRTETDRITAERLRREQELADLQAQMTSGPVSSADRERLNREIERKRTEAQRWLEDANREFQETQQVADAEFQNRLRPIVGEVARQNGFGLIFRTNPTLTMVLNPDLDITPRVIEAFNQAVASQPGGGEN
jgi:Skp family chaperone for outer membrane proteins